MSWPYNAVTGILWVASIILALITYIEAVYYFYFIYPLKKQYLDQEHLIEATGGKVSTYVLMNVHAALLTSDEAWSTPSLEQPEVKTMTQVVLPEEGSTGGGSTVSQGGGGGSGI